MDLQGLARSIAKFRRSLTDSRKARGDGYANLTRKLRIDAPFQVLSSDISYIRTDGGDYLCQIKDVTHESRIGRENDSESITTLGYSNGMHFPQ
jgi:hypothetical protein